MVLLLLEPDCCMSFWQLFVSHYGSELATEHLNINYLQNAVLKNCGMACNNHSQYEHILWCNTQLYGDGFWANEISIALQL